jgi:hypothetical protein
VADADSNLDEFIKPMMARGATIASTSQPFEFRDGLRPDGHRFEDHFFGDFQTMADVFPGATGTLRTVTSWKLTHIAPTNVCY